MDTSRLGRGEMIAGVAGVALFFVMFFDWYGVSGLPGGGSAWEVFGFIDIVLFATAVAAAGLAVATATSRNVGLPVAGSALTAGLGILAVLLILYRIINTPDVLGVDLDRKIGVFLGLICAGGVAYGGWIGMQEEGTSFSEQRDRLSGDAGGDAGGGEGGPGPAA